MLKHLTLVLVVCALALPALAGEDTKTETPKTDAPAAAKAELGKPAPAISMRDVDGRTFQLADAKVSRKDAEAMVMASAAKFGAAKDATLETKIADLSGVKDGDGDLDETLVKELAVACGEYVGLTATDESAAAFKTLADLATWVTAANDAPILLVTWSPRCPSVRRSNDRVVEMAAKTKVRLFAVASNTRDQDEHYAQFCETFEWNVRIFPDREQRVTDILGGKTTPHFFLFDAKGVLQYRGAMDNDPMGYMEDEERKNYIEDAVDAIRSGKPAPVQETEPSG